MEPELSSLKQLMAISCFKEGQVKEALQHIYIPLFSIYKIYKILLCVVKIFQNILIWIYLEVTNELHLKILNFITTYWWFWM